MHCWDDEYSFTNNTFDHFPNMQDQTEKYVTEICSVIQDFENRFCDFQKIRTFVEYLSLPFKSDLNM
jgi:hypothetical protein